MIKPLDDADGHTLGELGAFCTHPSCQGAGIGDSLLEWLGGPRPSLPVAFGPALHVAGVMHGLCLACDCNRFFMKDLLRHVAPTSSHYGVWC